MDERQGYEEKRTRLITVAEAAHLLGIGRTKTYELMVKGKFRSVKIDGCRRVVLGSLLDFIGQLMRDGEDAS